MPPRRSSRRSSRVAWTTATHHCSPSPTDYFDACNRCRTLPPAWSQAPVGVTTVSWICHSQQVTPSLRQLHWFPLPSPSTIALCSRSRGSYISPLLERLPRTSQTTVAFCRTLVVAHCGPTPMTCGSCSCREHITNSVIGVSWPPVLDCGTTFHLDYGTWPGLTFDSFRHRASDNL